MIEQIKQIKSRMKEIEKHLQSPDVSSDTKKMQTLSQEYSDLKEKTAISDLYEKIQEQLEQAKEEITKKAKEIQTSLFEPKPGMLCDFCEYKLLCDAWN